MPLAMSMWSYHRDAFAGRMGVSEFILEAKRIGVDGVELLDCFYKDPEVDRPAVLAALSAAGLPCPIFSVGNDFAKPSAEERAAELAKVRFGIEEAGRLGAGVVRVFAGDTKEGVDFDSARTWIVEGLTEASRIADGVGVRLALENHGRLAGRSDQVKGIIEDVRERAGNEALGANPDTGNFVLVDQPSHEAIRDLADYAHMVHFKDFARTDDPSKAMRSNAGVLYVGSAIGEGVVDLGACLEALDAVGFDGWLSIEYEGEEPSETAAARSAASARALLG